MTDQIEKPEEKPKRAPRTAKATEPELARSIGEIIPQIREELGVLGKEEKATAGASYQYRGHDTLVNALAPLLNKYGVYTTVQDQFVKHEGRAAGNKWVTTVVLLKSVTFHAPDGSSVTSSVLGESSDYSNKATNQAHTYAYRKAIEQTFTIPTGEPDPDSERIEFEPTTTAPATAPVAPAKPNPADEAAEINALMVEIGQLFEGAGVKREEIRPRITKYFNGREGWDKSVTPLTRVRDALKRGEDVGGDA